jgi:hypothetical protein
MTRVMGKRTSAVALTVVLVLGGGGVAFAYFTSAGSGSGSAAIGTVSGSDIVITESNPAGDIYPGSGPVGFTVQAQDTGSGDERVNDVSITVASDSSGNALDAAGVPIIGCLATWFSVSSPVTIDATLSPGSNSASVDTTIGLTEDGIDQDACQGARVKLIFATSSPV